MNHYRNLFWGLLILLLGSSQVVQAQTAFEFTLVNAGTDAEFVLSDGIQINLNEADFQDLASFNVFLSSFPEGTQSVRFVLEEFPEGFSPEKNPRVENVEPFSLFGDISETGKFLGEAPVLGDYKVSATAFSTKKAVEGNELGMAMIRFSFVEETLVQKINTILECVVDNGDGTLRAYFGYNNPNDFEVEVPIGSDNSFAGIGQNQGQPMLFVPGRVNGAFSVVFPTDAEITWSLSTGGMTSDAMASSRSDHCDVKPFLECVRLETFGIGSFVADFGYENGEAFAVEIPVGSRNNINGGGLNGDDQGQPTVFAPGRQEFDFDVPFNGTDLVWMLNGRSTSVANESTERCSGFVLINPATGEEFEVNKNNKINLNDPSFFGENGLANFNILYNQAPDENVQVEFTLTGPGPYEEPIVVVDNEAPYTLADEEGLEAVLSNPDYVIIVRVSSFGSALRNGANVIEKSIQNSKVDDVKLNTEEIPTNIILEDSICYRFELIPEEL
ncbi:MAG: hypothetical protein AAFU64_11120, partial [Bacteroidota bacterium]